MREFNEPAITREDRFMREMFEALIEEIELLRKEVKGNGTKRKTNAKPRSNSGNAE